MSPLSIMSPSQSAHISKKFKTNTDYSPPSVISWSAENYAQPDEHSVPSLSTHYSIHTTTPSTCIPSTNIVPLTDDDQDCVSFLMTLKYRTKNVDDDVKILKEGFRNARSEIHQELNSTVSARTEKNSNLHNTGIPLGLPCDSNLLSPLQSYIRSHCVEVFTASEDDCVNQPTRSRSKIKVGRVGIRCAFCHSRQNCLKRTAQSVSFPNQISGIYSAVVMIQSRHFKTCKAIPESVREHIEELKHVGRKNRGEGNKRNNYWVESAKMLGLVDTNDGIRFHDDAVKPSSQTTWEDYDEPDITSEQNTTNIDSPLHTNSCSQDLIVSANNNHSRAPNQVFIPTHISSAQILQDNLHEFLMDSHLFSREDADLVPPYLFLAMAQMKPCAMTKEDRVGCYKDREIGFRGMCCKHCGGAPGFGKYFPASVRSLAQTTTSQTIIKHVGTKCTKCPEDIKTLLEKLHKDGLAQGGNYGRGGKEANDGKPKYGSRKIFFQRLWARIHGEEVPPIPEPSKKEEEMSSLGDESLSVMEKSMTSVDETDDECWEEQKHHRRRRRVERKRKSVFV